MSCSPSRADTLGFDCSRRKHRGRTEVDVLMLCSRFDQFVVEEMYPLGKRHSS